MAKIIKEKTNGSNGKKIKEIFKIIFVLAQVSYKEMPGIEKLEGKTFPPSLLVSLWISVKLAYGLVQEEPITPIFVGRTPPYTTTWVRKSI